MFLHHNEKLDYKENSAELDRINKKKNDITNKKNVLIEREYKYLL